MEGCAEDATGSVDGGRIFSSFSSMSRALSMVRCASFRADLAREVRPAASNQLMVTRLPSVKKNFVRESTQ